MGYYSHVVIAHVMSDAHMTEVFAAYTILPATQEYNLAAEWMFDRSREGVTVVWYEAQCVKWRDSYRDVAGLLALGALVENFAEERHFQYASVLTRVGEDTADVEEDYSDNDESGSFIEVLHDCVGITRTIEVGLSEGDT